jgi:hypothetical protein
LHISIWLSVNDVDGISVIVVGKLKSG